MINVAEIFGSLWQYNLAKVVVVDVSDDYRLMQDPMPGPFYPVLKETYRPRYGLVQRLAEEELVSGFLYDWHESPQGEGGPLYVAVVRADLALLDPPTGQSAQ